MADAPAFLKHALKLAAIRKTLNGQAAAQQPSLDAGQKDACQLLEQDASNKLRVLLDAALQPKAGTTGESHDN